MLIAIVIVIIAGISLYEYFSSKTWQQVTSAERNEVVFEDRNHEYGAYQIRTNYSRNLILVMAGVILFIGTTFGIYKLIMNLPQEKPQEVPLDLSSFAMDAPMEEEIIEPLEPEIPPMEKTVQFLPPVVTDDEVTTPPPTQADLEDTKASNTTNENEGDPFAKIDPTPPKPKEEKVEKKEDVIYDIVDEPAEPDGGMAALKKYLAENIKYPQTAVEMGLEGKCYLQFVVSENGYISNVRVKKGVTDCPECDQEAIRVVKSMPRWKPGKINGKAVNSTFSLPVSFKLS